MNSNGLLEKVESAIKDASLGKITAKQHESNIQKLSEEVRVHSERLIGCGSYIYAAHLAEALNKLISVKVEDKSEPAPELIQPIYKKLKESF